MDMLNADGVSFESKRSRFRFERTDDCLRLTE